MIDERLLVEETEKVIENLKKRGDEDRIGRVERFLWLYNRRKELRTENERLRQERNRLTREIQERKKRGESAEELLEAAKRIPERLKVSDEELERVEKEMREILMDMPNILHPVVPVGKDDSENVPIRYWSRGKVKLPRRFMDRPPEGLEWEEFEVPHHVDMIARGLADIERAGKVAGSRFFYLMNDLVRLEYSLILYGLDFLAGRGFTLLEPPFMARREVEEAATSLGDFRDVIYKLEGENLYLIPTSEHPLLGYHMNEVLDEKDLPLRYAGISPCFRKEAGSHGKDTKGIFRTHQFQKVEQFVYSHPDKSWEEFEMLIRNAEEFFQSLGIPYRVVDICTGDIGMVAARKYDIEAWLPGQGKFREVVSCSNCTDWQARRANIRARRAPGEKAYYVHTLNSTLVATNRTMIAIMENHWEGNGFAIPKPLQPYFGKDFVEVGDGNGMS